MMKLSTLKFVVLFCPIVVTAMSQPKTKVKYEFPAVMAFGDSILDTGNNNYIETIVKANFEPYGRDLNGGKPSGRFSNGRIPSDFFVEMLGIKKSLPPYLDPNLKIEDLLTGVSFASAGSGYDPVTNELAKVLSVEDQLKMFIEYKGKVEKAVGKERTDIFLAESIFIISMGTNDIAGTYFMTPYRKVEYNIQVYTSLLVNMTSSFLQELYRLGARKIGVFSLAPIGCLPLERATGGGMERDCVESFNQAAKFYNSKLRSSLQSLSKIHPNARLVYLENYSELNKIIKRHKQYGFEDGDSPCCSMPAVELGPLCNSFALRICENATMYVFWDSIHPTERTYFILSAEIIKEEITKFH